jgi:O-antigen/teichoic acid export membrane protein
LGSGNNWVRKTYYNSIASISGGIINIFILYFFIKIGGIVVAAIGFTSGSIIQAILLLYTSQKNHFIPYSNFNLLISFILLTGYSLVPYFSFQYLGLFSFIAIQFFVGVAILGVMYFTIFTLDERRKIVNLVGLRTI